MADAAAAAAAVAVDAIAARQAHVKSALESSPCPAAPQSPALAS